SAVMISWVFFGKRPSLRAVEPGQRRRYMSFWLGNFIGMVLVALTIARMVHGAGSGGAAPLDRPAGARRGPDSSHFRGGGHGARGCALSSFDASQHEPRD